MLRWAGHVACRVLVGASEGKRYLEDLDIDGKIRHSNTGWQGEQ